MSLAPLKKESVSGYARIIPGICGRSLPDLFFNVGIDLIALEPESNLLTELAHEVVEQAGEDAEIDELNLRLNQLRNFYNESIGWFEQVAEYSSDSPELEELIDTLRALIRTAPEPQLRLLLADRVYEALEETAFEYGFYDLLSDETMSYEAILERLGEEGITEIPLLKIALNVLTDLDLLLGVKRDELSGEELVSVSASLSMALASLNRLRQLRWKVQRETAKIGRNDLCPCGSGKKYKKCCMPR